MRFSKTTGCFYPKSLDYSDLPGDIFDVTAAEFMAAMNRQPEEALDVVNGRVVVVSAPANSLDELKSARQREIKSAVGAAIVSGITSSVLGAAHNYPTTAIDQQNLNGLVTETLLPGSGDEYKFWCADSAGVWARRIHTKSQIQSVGIAVADHVKTQQAKYEQKLADIDAATLTTIDLITWS